MKIKEISSNLVSLKSVISSESAVLPNVIYTHDSNIFSIHVGSLSFHLSVNNLTLDAQE